MPRGSRHKSHRQHHKQSVKDLADSDEGENTRYGPELLPEPKTEGKRLREEGKLEISKEKHEIQKKKSQPQSRELGPGNSSATYFPAKKKKGEALEAVETEASVVSPPPLSVDRWNGGEAQGDALSLLAYLHCNKDKDSKTDSESSDRNVGFVEDKEDGRIEEKSHKLAKGKAPDAGSGSSRPLAIDTPDAFQPNANAKASRNKGSRRREAQEATISQGSSLKFAEETPLVAKVDPDTLNSGKSTLAKSATTKSGTKGRWDKGVARKELKEVDEGTTSRDAQRSSERDKKLRNTKPEKVLGVVAGTVRNLEGNSKQGFSNEGFQEEASDKQEQKNTEWQLQDELRNIELEKELENRIQRRREESGERDRWRDDDRDGEGKRFYRDDRYRDDRYKDEKQRDDRHKDDRHRDDRHKDEVPRDDRYREEKYIEDHHRDDKYQDDKQREQRLSRERAFDKHESKHSREGSRAPEGRYRESKHYDSDRDYSFHYEDRYTHHRDHRDNSRLSRNREGSRETKTRGNKESATEGDCKGTSMGHQDENLGRERLSVLPCFDAGDVVVNDKQQKRVRGMGSNVGREEHRLKLKQAESDSKDTSFEEKPQRTREERVTRNLNQLRDHSREPGILRCKNRAEKKLEGYGDESPRGSARSSPYDGRTSPISSYVESSPKTNGRLSPVNVVQKSPSPYIRDMGHPFSYEKAVRKNKVENGNNANSASGMHRQANRSWHSVGASERGKQQFGREGKACREPGGISKSTDDHRIRSPSSERVHDSQTNNSNIDETSRAPSVASCRVGGSQDSRWVSSGGASASGERPSKGRRLEEIPSSRSDWTPHPAQMNRPMGSPIRPQVPSMAARPPGLLPPPPPFRPGIDNPAILGTSNSGFEEVPSSRDQRRVDRQVGAHFNRGEGIGGAGQGDVWKGVGNWNSHAQGPGPSNMFLPFQHHIGGHPHGGFLNMGQQFAGPPMFGIGVRPSADMGHSGARYHMRDGGDVFHGHNRTFGWQRQADDICGPPIQVPLHAWDGPGSYGEESHMYGRPDRDQSGQGMGNRNWDRATDMWKVNTRETDDSWGGPRGRPEKIRRERSPTASIEIKRSEEDPPKIIAGNQLSTLVCDVQKPSKSKDERVSLYLSKLDISAGLAGPDLYNQCVGLLDSGGNTISSNKVIMKDLHTEGSDDDSQLEVDADAEALVHSFDVRATTFPSLPKDAFQRALALYRKVKGGINLEPVVNSYVNLSRDKLDEVIVASQSSKEDPPCTTVYDKRNTDVDVAVASGHVSADPEMDVASANELTYSLEQTVQNEIQMVQAAPDMVPGGDRKEDILISPNQSSQIHSVKGPVDNVNTRGFLEEPVDNINSIGFSAESADNVIDMGFSKPAGDVDAMGFSEDPSIDVGATFFLGRPAEDVEESADAVDAIDFSEELVADVKPMGFVDADQALSEVKEKAIIAITEASETILSGCIGDADFSQTKNSATDHLTTKDSCALMIDSTMTFAEPTIVPDSVFGSKELAREDGGEAESDTKMLDPGTVSQVCEFHERNDNVEMDALSMRCSDANLRVEDSYGHTAIQQDELLESTDLAREKAMKFELIESKIGIGNLSQYNLPGNTR